MYQVLSYIHKFLHYLYQLSHDFLEVLNIFQAEEINCHIITVPSDLLKKLHNINKNLESFSKETVLDFYNDAQSAGYKI